MANISLESISENNLTHYLEQINEVYGADYPANGSDFRKDLIILLSNRIIFGSFNNLQKESALLSTLPLMNDTNPLIGPFVPGTFDKSTFNPLRYGFNFFAKNEQWFRIDGTDYIMIVKPFTAER